MASTKRLNAVLTIGGAVASSLGAAIGVTKGKLGTLGREVETLTRKQKLLGESIKVFGKQGRYVDGLRRQYVETTAALERMRQAQDRLNRSQERGKTIATAGAKIGAAGVGATVAGAAIGSPLFKGVREASGYQAETGRIAALGMGEATTRQAVDFAKSMKTFGTSALENLTLVRDALSVFSDLGHTKMAAPILARMKFANAAFFGAEHGTENEAKFMDMLKVIELRGGTKSEADFAKQANMIQRVISATGGRVGGEEWRHVIARGGLAAQGMRDDAFYYQLEPLVQMMSGDAVGTGLASSYQALYQGKTTKRAMNNLARFGLIADRSKVHSDKVGQIAQMDPGALKGADLFRQSQYEWVKQILIPTLAQHGMTSREQIEDAIGSIVSNKVGANLLSKMYDQQSLIDKDEHRNRSAFDIDQLDDQARGTAPGKQLQAEADMGNLKLRMGTAILPLYTRALTFAASALEKLNGFIDRNPTVSKVLLVSFAAVAGALVTVGPLLIGLGGTMAAVGGTTMLLAKVGMTWGSVLSALVAPIRWVATAVMFLGRAMLMNPIGLAITGIAVGAFLIYKYWKPIKAFFVDLWDGIRAKTMEVSDWIVAKMKWIGDSWQKVKEFFGFGASAAPAPASAGASAPVKAPIVAHGRGGQPVHQQTNHIYITQQPGQSASQLADEIAKKLKEKDAQRERGALYDPANAMAY